MTNELQVFSYEGNDIRTVRIDGETCWVAKDVCDVFGETNRNRAMQPLDEDEKGYTQMTTPAGRRISPLSTNRGFTLCSSPCIRPRRTG
jgi:prophage antirepressor-like protein